VLVLVSLKTKVNYEILVINHLEIDPGQFHLTDRGIFNRCPYHF